MSRALSPEARERMVACADDAARLGAVEMEADLRALLADSDALAAAERERDAFVAKLTDDGNVVSAMVALNDLLRDTAPAPGEQEA